jgi:hypothetical protein
MSIDLPAEPTEAVGRPRTVDLGLYAVLARCVLGLLSAVALYAARPRIISDFRSSEPTWSDAKLHHEASSYLRGNLLVAIAFVVMVLLVAKFIRDGRNWARWFYALISVFPTSDIFKVAVFGQSVPFLFKITTGLTGVAAIVAISFFFVRPSRPYFRKATVEGGPARAPMMSFRGLLSPRSMQPSRGPIEPPTKPAATPGDTGTARRRPTRPKSRRVE